ncbi:MAG: hypothetical protein EZS28_005046 [Streblomastix strix]|uniref:Uncharacterized protein n=1 Tax=Streblomastix strix TaxID=222440 RepID=A0A5J4WWK6_9EUKA|nr:MAG: hypothetical protein EZS28_005046 [Streblomastix strix]
MQDEDIYEDEDEDELFDNQKQINEQKKQEQIRKEHANTLLKRKEHVIKFVKDYVRDHQESDPPPDNDPFNEKYLRKLAKNQIIKEFDVSLIVGQNLTVQKVGGKDVILLDSDDEDDDDEKINQTKSTQQKNTNKSNQQPSSQPKQQGQYWLQEMHNENIMKQNNVDKPISSNKQQTPVASRTQPASSPGLSGGSSQKGQKKKPTSKRILYDDDSQNDQDKDNANNLMNQVSELRGELQKQGNNTQGKNPMNPWEFN